MKRLYKRYRHRLALLWLWGRYWWFNRQWTKRARRVRQIMNERENKFAVLQSKHDRLQRIVQEVWDELYGKGFAVHGWHMNGDLEPLDTWFEDNDWTEEAN